MSKINIQKIISALVLIVSFLSLLFNCSENIVGSDFSFFICYTDYDAYPAWSPDGSKIVYYHRGMIEVGPGAGYITDPDSMGLWMVDADGGNPHILFTTNSIVEADWSPDGNWLVLPINHNIFKAPVIGDSVDIGKVEKLSTFNEVYAPDWSPDGEWIAFSKGLDDQYGQAGTWIMKPDGSDKQYVFRAGIPDWHPDGNSIISVRGVSSTSIWKRFIIYYPFIQFSPDTLNALIGKNNFSPKFSPDGLKIAFESNPFDTGEIFIMLMNYDGTNIITLIKGKHHAWSPDGKKIAFIGIFNEPEKPMGTVWVVDVDGSNLKQLTFGIQ